MPEAFVIQGPATLSGDIPVYGSKNAALPLMAAALLTKESVTLTNMPAISDIKRMSTIFTAIGASVRQEGTTLTIEATSIDASRVPAEEVGHLRGSILLLGALLARSPQVSIPVPGGDIIGARPIDAHIDGFKQLGAKVTLDDQVITIDGSGMKAGRVVLSEFSVTATENILLAAARLPGTTTIELAAAEPHVAALAMLLTAMGAPTTGGGTHTITVEGNPDLHGATFENIQDMLEAGLFILLAAATQSALTITGVPIHDLTAFFKKIDAIGISYNIQNPEAAVSDVTVTPSALRAFRVQALPHPGLATDLQAPFSVIATQADGACLIHDPLYEGRFKHIYELQKMGADAVTCDPHRVIVTGKTPLRGREIPSLDIRSGATLIMAGLVANGQTTIHGADIVDRGYADLTGRLKAIGADIKRTSDV